MRFIFEKDTWQEIFDAIKKNKLRTLITIIGVLWGVFLFIVLQGAAKGMDNGFKKEFKDMATNSIFLWGQQTSVPYAGYSRNRPISLKIADTKAILQQIKGVTMVVPRNAKGIFDGNAPLVATTEKSGNYKVFGDFPAIDKVSKKKIRSGRFLNTSDIQNQRRVCVIGDRIQKELFKKDIDPLGQYIKINGMYFKVVGVYKKNSTDFFEGDNSVFIPFSTYTKIFNTADTIGWMVISAHKDQDIKKIEEQVLTFLKRKHKVSPKDTRAFGAANFGEAFGKISGFTKGLNTVTLIVGIATLLAGVIAIGNILLITVKERTGEIGIRRALGATPSQIRGQIILEAVFLTLIAGVLGIIFGGITLSIIDIFTKNQDTFPFSTPTVPLSYIFLAVVIMVVLGSLIGLIPAQRAIKIRPIEALREQ